jgi:POT family proton-dependent oligopeptide transporter
MLIAWVAVAAWVAFVIFTNRKVHPRALFALFMVELWERFSYYGMRAILVLYMTSQLMSQNRGFGYDDAKAYGIYGAYGALVYLTPIIGGYFADKMMGFRKAILWGALLMAAGQFTLFMDNETTFYIGLALLVIGNGFFKPNISSMIGRFYPAGDPRRDSAFTIFYMGINIGAFLTPLTCGAIGEIEGWRYGFLAAGLGMILGFLIFTWAQRTGWFEHYGLKPEGADDFKVAGMGSNVLPYVTTLIMVPLAWMLIKQNDIVDILLGIFAVIILSYLLLSSGKYDHEQKQRIWVIVVLLLFTTVFWTFFELAGSAMNLFTERNVNKNFLGFELATTFFQAVNPLFIMIFAPLYSWMWIKLASANREPAAPYKFGVGLIMLGLGFLVLNMGKASAIVGLVPALFLIMLYLFHTLGELTLSPVGLSLVTKLAPAQIVGFLMGIWFLSSSIAHQAGKHIARWTAVDETEIISTEKFKGCLPDATVFTGLQEGFVKEMLEKEVTLDNAMIDKSFVEYLNQKAGQPQYYVGTVQVQEWKERAEKIKLEQPRKEALEASFRKFLTKDPAYADAAGVKLLPRAEANKVVEASTSGEVISCLRQDTLDLGLGVFRKLGFFAIGCGLLLFLLGPIISRWMHGIK